MPSTRASDEAKRWPLFELAGGVLVEVPRVEVEVGVVLMVVELEAADIRMSTRPQQNKQLDSTYQR